MLNKTSKAVRLATLGALAAGAMSVAPVASAEVEVAGSVAIANMYLWRGNDLGNGNAAVSGDISVSAGGAYAGVWGSSGDSAAGTEYDLFAGYGAEFGGVSVDLSVWNYLYPTSAEAQNDTDNFGGLSEVILSVGFMGVSAAIYDNVAGGSGYEYYTLGYSYDAYSVTFGKHDAVGGGDDIDMVHLDLSYAYNDNLSFTFSQQVDEKADDDLKFVVSYSLPLM